MDFPRISKHKFPSLSKVVYLVRAARGHGAATELTNPQYRQHDGKSIHPEEHKGLMETKTNHNTIVSYANHQLTHWPLGDPHAILKLQFSI